MTRIGVGLIASVLLSSGCAHKRVLPDPSIPHRVAEEANLTIWVRGSNGKLTKQPVKILEGWWVASPQVVE